jgi:Tol biopolymer transport system component
VTTRVETFHPRWSPDGRTIAFSRRPTQDLGKITDFHLTPISFIDNPQLSRDGSQLAYSRGRITSDIWLMTISK